VQTHTSTTLLEGLKDHANDEVWRRFDARYRPIVTALARKLGLDDATAAEVAQGTMVEFVKSYREGKYQRGSGRLSSWILGIAQHLISGARRAAVKHPARGESAFVDLPNGAALTAIWQEQQRKSILAEAMTQLRATSRVDERTIRAFELVALRGVPAQAAAEECGMSVAEVYVAKNRMTGRLRRIVEELSGAYQEDG
jgi:DNA-directed RNA polymerase specialized sigma24 family protein